MSDLPPLPEPALYIKVGVLSNQSVGRYTTDQMQDYARAAVAAAQKPYVPLTDAELFGHLRSIDSDAVRLPSGFRAFARIVEAAVLERVKP